MSQTETGSNPPQALSGWVSRRGVGQQLWGLGQPCPCAATSPSHPLWISEKNHQQWGIVKIWNKLSVQPTTMQSCAGLSVCPINKNCYWLCWRKSRGREVCKSNQGKCTFNGISGSVEEEREREGHWPSCDFAFQDHSNQSSRDWKIYSFKICGCGWRLSSVDWMTQAMSCSLPVALESLNDIATCAPQSTSICTEVRRWVGNYYLCFREGISVKNSTVEYFSPKIAHKTRISVFCDI